jgi:hypothetical protein
LGEKLFSHWGRYSAQKNTVGKSKAIVYDFVEKSIYRTLKQYNNTFYKNKQNINLAWNGVKIHAVIFRLYFFGPNIGPNVKKVFPQFDGEKFPIAW